MILLEFTGQEDFWGNKILQDANGTQYQLVDGIPHFITDEGEPLYPIPNYKIQKKTWYYVLSPDGFTLNPNSLFETKDEAWLEFETWKKRFDRQGYYSTVKNNQRVKIPLDELKKHCKLEHRTL